MEIKSPMIVGEEHLLRYINKESDTTLSVSFTFFSVTHFHFSLSYTGEGNGNPFQ